MRDLAFEFFQRSPVMAAPLLAMLIFVAIFVAVCVRALRASRVELDRIARSVLDAEKEAVDAER